MSAKPLKVVLCWHMHQPSYRDPITGHYQVPWTYLHAIKDYVDMAAHLEAEPAARAVVNFSPTLLGQIDAYQQQLAAGLREGKPIEDPMLEALRQPVIAGDRDARLLLVKACLRINRQRIIERYEPFRQLAAAAEWVIANPESLIYLNDQFLIDLLVWYHLGWLGETVKRGDERAQRLLKQGRNYTLSDRQELLTLMMEVMTGLIPRYRLLAERGQIELSITPYSHPILPLLLDFNSAREAWPDVMLPVSDHYPGGEERAQWQIQHALATFEHYFGHRPQGCWPAEGGVCARSLKLLEQAGFSWVASGQGVLRHSLKRDNPDSEQLHRPYHLKDGQLACFFRDDGLSDDIGFLYRDWHADDAVANLIHSLETIAAAPANAPGRVVSIIMDGENAWEYYPENGYYFLSALYKRLAHHPALELTTFADCLKEGKSKAVPVPPLDQLVAGSWVYGTFSTWIGDPDKNRAWDMLVEAKRAFDLCHPKLAPSQQAAAELQLAICEASDWFWWLGNGNPDVVVSQFERLFRLQLAGLYQTLGREAPNYLSHVFTHGTGHGEVATMRRT